MTRVAYLGHPGAYAHRAACCLLPGAEARGEPTPAAAVAAVLAGGAAAAVLPVENRYGGPVAGAAELLADHGLCVGADVWLPIRHVLAAFPGTSWHSVRHVLSHPQALAQCAPYLAAHGMRAEARDSTSDAAREVAARRRPDLAALCSPDAAQLYGLEVVAHRVTAIADNRTRFWLLRHEPAPAHPAPSRFTAVVGPVQSAGSVHALLAEMRQAGMTVTRILPLAAGRLLIDGAGDPLRVPPLRGPAPARVHWYPRHRGPRGA